eukprot:gene17449-23001_t
MIPFSLSGTAKTSKTTTDNRKNFTNTTVRNIPDWGQDLARRGAERVGEFYDEDPQSQVAPVNALLTGAAQGAAGLSQQPDTDMSWLQPHMTSDTPFASGGKAYDFVDRYKNPYLKSVLAAIIVVAVWQLVDFKHLRHTWRYDRGDGAAQAATI